MSENSVTSQTTDKPSSEVKMGDEDEGVIEKIDYYANKVNVFFAMQPAIETLSKLVTEKKNVIKMIKEGMLCDETIHIKHGYMMISSSGLYQHSNTDRW